MAGTLIPAADAALQDAIWAFVQSDPYWRANKLCQTPTAAFKLATTTSKRERGLMSQFLAQQQIQPQQTSPQPQMSKTLGAVFNLHQAIEEW